MSTSKLALLSLIRLSSSFENRLQLLYKKSVRSSSDPFKKAIYCVLARCELNDNHSQVLVTTEDYMWLKVCPLVTDVSLYLYINYSLYLSPMYQYTSYQCTNVPVTYVPMYQLPMCQCTSYLCIDVPVTYVPIYKLPMYQCTSYLCTDVPVTYVPMYQLPMYQCTSYLCNNVPVTYVSNCLVIKDLYLLI